MVLGMKSQICLGAMLAFSVGFAANGEPYTWPGYRSDLDYDTKSNIGVINPPTQFNDNCSGVTGKKAGKWWAFYWGADRDARVTDETIDSLLAKYDRDFTYLYDSLGWAPDAQAQEGKYSAVYYYGSGTCAGGKKTDTTGGWQTSVAGYTAVAASFYPVYSFNPSCTYSDKVSQQDAMIHEGIHSMTNGYPGAKSAHWFQEAGNTWIQQDMFSHRNKVYSGMGFLNAATVIAPFIPIECYSGWLIDGTFGGPGAQGVNANQRYLLGGTQYSNIFPTFIGTWLSTGAVRWIYGNATEGDNNTYLLETYGKDYGLGDAGVRRLITEFRARLALLDMKDWSEEMRNLLNQNFGVQTYWEQDYWNNKNYSYTWTMTPYQTMTASGEYLVPQADITPGWSGANQIPLKVQSGASEVTVSFYLDGANSTSENMNFLLCYRATDGTPIYSEPITGEGSVTLKLDKRPSSTNGSEIIFALAVNTEYAFSANTSLREKHYGYKLKLESGISGAGDANTAYYRNFTLNYDWDKNVSSSSAAQSSSSVTPSSSSMASSSSAGSSSSVEITETKSFDVSVTLPIDDNYAGKTFDLKLSEVASYLGISASEISAKATYFAKNLDGSANTTSTAVAPGHWFDNLGNPVSYGESAYIYSEFNLSAGTASVGHYPNRVADKETYKFTQGISYGKKQVLYNVTVAITNESGSEESGETTSLAYGITGPAKNIDLSFSRGILNVSYTLKQRDNVKISLFSPSGALLFSEVTELKSAGTHNYQIDLKKSGLPASTYIVKITTGDYREARPISISR